MSALSTDQLPRAADSATLSVTYQKFGETAGAYVVTFTVLAAGLNGRAATATLVSDDVFFLALYLPSLSGYNYLNKVEKTIYLVNTPADAPIIGTLELPKTAFFAAPNVRYRIYLKCGSRLVMTRSFTLQPPVVIDCDCGDDVGAIFKTKPYTPKNSPTLYGPAYAGDARTMATFDWGHLLTGPNAITPSERLIMEAVIANEAGTGRAFNTMHAWDTATFTFGIMQKIIDRHGSGELATQLAQFKRDNQILFDYYLGKCGWSVQKSNGQYYMYYADPDDPSAVPITGSQLRAKFREGFTEVEQKSKLIQESRLMAPFVRLGENTEFKEKQVRDYVSRLNNIVLKLTPDGTTHTVAEFFDTDKGRALVLDNHVNSPGTTEFSLGRALTDLVERKAIPKDKDPTTWGAKHAQYEQLLIAEYGPTRKMVDPKGRYGRIVDFFNKPH